MLISVINRSRTLADEQVQDVLRVINRQIDEDFKAYWSFGARLRLEGTTGRVDTRHLGDLRGDAILYLYDKTDVDDALGYHEANWRGIPYGFVFTELAAQLGESWTVTLSHEALELIGDAQANLLVQGPHPGDAQHEVFHWFELCDAVQAESYVIDGVEVSNFVLPSYFTVEDEPGTRNDFLGRKDHNGNTLKSFGVKAGGYVGFYDPASGQSEQWSPPDDEEARQRRAIKGKVAGGRSYMRKHSNALASNEKRHRASLQPQPKSSESNDQEFEHIFVLMLENRSFDHMLGSLAPVLGVDGIDTTRSNKDAAGKTFMQAAGAADRLPAQDTDPGHEFANAAHQSNKGAMDGFVTDYETTCQQRGVAAATAERYKPEIMRYFDADTLPVLHTLARHFVVCDRWFSSLPGPTWPNRAFVHSGTSAGIIDMPEDASTLGDFRFYPQETLYNKLSAAGIDWRIYHGGLSQTVVFSRLLKYLPTDHYSSFDDFKDDMQQAPADIPRYVFIEPDFFGKDRSDQHPPGSVTSGERLIAQVYDAIRANEALWQKSLLVLLWDEHGGFYDHVAPGTTVAPDDDGDAANFARLGLRVPAVLVSPRLRAGVCSTPFDHTSLLRYVCEQWQLPQLGARAASANSLQQAMLWAAHVRGENETPANLQAKVKAVQPPSPQEPPTAVRGRRTQRAPLPENFDVVDAHGKALLLAVQAAAATLKQDGKPAVRGARMALRPTAVKALKPEEGKALFARLSGRGRRQSQ